MPTIRQNETSAMPTLDIRQIMRATGLGRYVVDQWISRGYFNPEQPGKPGVARKFTVTEAIRLGAMAELTRLGIPPKMASQVTGSIAGFGSDDAILVVWQLDLAIYGDIIKPDALASLIGSRSKRAFAVVNLIGVEDQVRAVVLEDS